ncbi:fimbrial protein [Salmonella enterica]|nr:fimbrial protein [Salmonella enterica]EIP6687084.1 fimbrial protein [Salmonella enterica subsp. enterica serovar Javiana]EIP6742430.1 fimbrial protein [Salmonella enterica subsp. enterica serovar Javiana]EIQ4670390.1 fimbrial protein [Salmonella enterica subsp. enterica serovar Javiana]EIR2402429.1 fimbrial protein [Salmonella enterica subsp. enterica serovar Javiana]
MNMKTSFIAAAVALATICSFSVSAVQKDITVTANIDSTLELLQADGSSLPSAMKLDFMPGKGLVHKSLQTRLYSNDQTKGVNVRLLNAPQLVNVMDPTKTIDMDVTLGGKSLTTANSLLAADTLFPGGKTGDGSAMLSLDIGQKAGAGTALQNLPAGDYNGVVSLVISQAVTTG